MLATPTPVTVKRVDKNGTEVTVTYTPTVTKVTPQELAQPAQVSKVNRKRYPNLHRR